MLQQCWLISNKKPGNIYSALLNSYKRIKLTLLNNMKHQNKRTELYSNTYAKIRSGAAIRAKSLPTENDQAIKRTRRDLTRALDSNLFNALLKYLRNKT